MSHSLNEGTDFVPQGTQGCYVAVHEHEHSMAGTSGQLRRVHRNEISSPELRNEDPKPCLGLLWHRQGVSSLYTAGGCHFRAHVPNWKIYLAYVTSCMATSAPALCRDHANVSMLL